MRLTNRAVLCGACCCVVAQACSGSSCDGGDPTGGNAGAAASGSGGKAPTGGSERHGSGGVNASGVVGSDSGSSEDSDSTATGGDDGGGSGGSDSAGSGGTGATREPPIVEAEAYYVAMNGTDNDVCSEAAPCRTLQHVANVASEPGSVVFVADGEYVGFHSIHDGITFYASGDNVAVNDEHSWSSGQTGDNINIENNNDIVVDGFIVRDADRAGIRVVNADNVVVRNNRVGPNGRWGIFTGFAEQVQILNNETFGSEGEHGVYVSNSDSTNDDPIIRGNRVHGNNNNGIQINGDCHAGGDGVVTGAIVEDNWVYDNGFKGLSIISAPDVLIRNNVIVDNGLRAGAGGIHLVNEPDCDPSQSTSGGVVVNNTVVEPRIAGIRMNLDATNNIIFNNLLVSSTPIADEVGGNQISSSNLSLDSTAGLFGEDYQLVEGSSAIDAGEAQYGGVSAPAVAIDGTVRPQGDGFDVGAHEYQ